MQLQSIAFGLFVGIFAAACGGVSVDSTAGAGSATSASDGGSHSAPFVVQDGKRIYDYGVGPSGQIIPRSGGPAMMAASGCANCHGENGHGASTMMFSAPDITYGNLTDPAGMHEMDGTRGPTYDDEEIRRAVVDGVGADGDELSWSMPRWQLGDQEWADLLAYLKTLD